MCSGKHHYTTQEWIEKAKVEYKNARTKICIICPEQGCPKCKSSNLERDVRDILQKNNINFIEQHSFDWLKNGKGIQTLDFYMSLYNIAIECQGAQHFEQN